MIPLKNQRARKILALYLNYHLYFCLISHIHFWRTGPKFILSINLLPAKVLVALSGSNVLEMSSRNGISSGLIRLYSLSDLLSKSASIPHSDANALTSSNSCLSCQSWKASSKLLVGCLSNTLIRHICIWA